jgi:hypothetical protein
VCAGSGGKGSSAEFDDRRDCCQEASSEEPDLNPPQDHKQNTFHCDEIRKQDSHGIDGETFLA